MGYIVFSTWILSSKPYQIYCMYMYYDIVPAAVSYEELCTQIINLSVCLVIVIGTFVYHVC